ncbi:YfiR family protein [methane-oxidizing endosymbiont of Gigantopelta aegis]|uniref:YfiR family protein n=1 Tax=methane-oxidizing endosymbiont of Gigantopelta aegis TaxID=2794938 RepID=UPI0018DC64C7|nr:YfiR family protein [methane-oxidizing endosymbiont of Gigantopelta aegis]
MLKSSQKLNYCLVVLLFFSNIGGVSAQVLDKPAVFALLTFNIARFTRWPPLVLPAISKNIQICVVGDNIIRDAFYALERESKRKRNIQIRYLSRLRKIQQCHVLYISGLKQDILRQVLNQIKKQPILTVGEGREFVQNGGMVAFEVYNKKTKLMINLSALKQAGLSINARILKLAEIVTSPFPNVKTVE